jgi:hypothetical protein
MAKIYVTTVLRQRIEGPEDYDKQDVFNFLAEQQSFREAFCRSSDGEFEIVDIEVIEEDID